MINYDPAKPLIFIHVPKTAGSSVRAVFEDWFGEGLILHYHRGSIPDVIDLKARHNAASPVCLYGHFNAERGFGIPGRYDDQRQFMTILRDPLEKVISAYFFVRLRAQQAAKPTLQEQLTLDLSLGDYVRQTRHNYLKHFPVPVTLENYSDVIERYFIAVGITEELPRSMAWIAQCLDRPAPDIPRLNVTPRGQGYGNYALSAADRAAFEDNHRLERMVYDYCRARLMARSGR